jgi:hypothetical protein
MEVLLTHRGSISVVTGDTIKPHGKELLMSPVLVALCYGSAIAASLFLLWYFGAKHWYWHALSVIASLVIGLTPMNEFWHTPYMTLVVGWVFLFLFCWGLVAPVFALSHQPPHPHLRGH